MSRVARPMLAISVEKGRRGYRVGVCNRQCLFGMQFSAACYKLGEGLVVQVPELALDLVVGAASDESEVGWAGALESCQSIFMPWEGPVVKRSVKGGGEAGVTALGVAFQYIQDIHTNHR